MGLRFLQGVWGCFLICALSHAHELEQKTRVLFDPKASDYDRIEAIEDLGGIKHVLMLHELKPSKQTDLPSSAEIQKLYEQIAGNFEQFPPALHSPILGLLDDASVTFSESAFQKMLDDYVRLSKAKVKGTPVRGEDYLKILSRHFKSQEKSPSFQQAIRSRQSQLEEEVLNGDPETSVFQIPGFRLENPSRTLVKIFSERKNKPSLESDRLPLIFSQLSPEEKTELKEKHSRLMQNYLDAWVDDRLSSPLPVIFHNLPDDKVLRSFNDVLGGETRKRIFDRIDRFNPSRITAEEKDAYLARKTQLWNSAFSVFPPEEKDIDHVMLFLANNNLDFNSVSKLNEVLLPKLKSWILQETSQKGCTPTVARAWKFLGEESAPELFPKADAATLVHLLDCYQKNKGYHRLTRDSVYIKRLTQIWLKHYLQILPRSEDLDRRAGLALARLGISDQKFEKGLVAAILDEKESNENRQQALEALASNHPNFVKLLKAQPAMLRRIMHSPFQTPLTAYGTQPVWRNLKPQYSTQAPIPDMSLVAAGLNLNAILDLREKSSEESCRNFCEFSERLSREAGQLSDFWLPETKTAFSSLYAYESLRAYSLSRALPLCPSLTDTQKYLKQYKEIMTLDPSLKDKLRQLPQPMTQFSQTEVSQQLMSPVVSTDAVIRSSGDIWSSIFLSKIAAPWNPNSSATVEKLREGLAKNINVDRDDVFNQREKYGSMMHTFAYLMSMDELRRSGVSMENSKAHKNLKEIYAELKKRKKTLQVPYYVSDSQGMSPENSYARNIPFYLNLYELEKDPKQKAEFRQQLVKAMDFYFSQLPDNIFLGRHGHVHLGSSDRAPYFLFSSLPFVAQALNLLSAEKSSDGAKFESQKNLFKKILQALPGQSGLVGSATPDHPVNTRRVDHAKIYHNALLGWAQAELLQEDCQPSLGQPPKTSPTPPSEPSHTASEP